LERKSIVLFVKLAPQTRAVEPEPKFPAPAPKNCLGSDSTALVERVLLLRILAFAVGTDCNRGLTQILCMLVTFMWHGRWPRT